MERDQKREHKSRGITELARMGPVGELFNVHLRRVDAQLVLATEKVWQHKKLRTGTIGALSYIVAHPGASQNDIVRSVTFDKSAMVAIIDGLENLGWAERRKSATDKRRHEVYATPEGEKELRRMVAEIKEIEARLFADMAVASRTRLIELLDELYASCLNSSA